MFVRIKKIFVVKNFGIELTFDGLSLTIQQEENVGNFVIAISNFRQ